MDRQVNRQVPQDIQNYPFDVIVVGAGINGAGIARDAAMRGLKVLLLDKEDISSGTTQWATRLIHGGLRYLQYYEFPLVRESLRDRELLFRIAPHLVRPLGFCVPIYDYMDRGPLIIRMGMILYDALSFEKTVGGHQMLSAEETLERYPGLNPQGLKGAAFYYDGQSEYAERIAVENAISARDHGAVVLTYAKVERLIMEGGNVTGVEFSDELNGGKYKVFAPVTVNVAGPWVDEVLEGLENRSENRMIGGTKGSHIVVDPFPGAPETALYVEAESDGRPYFIVPWNGRYLIGTTDIRYDGDLDHVEADDEEIEYLINETNRTIPGANLGIEDVLFTYSGVRPLPYQPEGSTSSVTRSRIIYDHTKHEPEVGGLISIIGGKLTTYRNLSRETVNEVYDKLHLHAPRSNTG
ncbi:MAG: glycerol-3-phosphate dehydrogenase/oxidase, partial [Actinomycetota bacterium]|nr:glycerol-3-phosphate dehydrogenase/oxidase [Actinomycetota bacterium]